MKNQDIEGCKYAYGSLIWKVCGLWMENLGRLGEGMGEDEREFVRARVEEKRKRF